MRLSVFIPSTVILISFVVFTIAMPETSRNGLEAVMTGIVDWFSWYYMALVSAFVVFAIWIGASHFGDIKLGPDQEKAEFGLLTWFTMLFAAGMGIGLVFFGVAEPLTHFASPKPGTDTDDVGALAEQGLVQTFLHWGLHPWAIYVIVGLAVAYAVHRRGRPISIRWALEPLLGYRIVKGALGDVIDVAAVIGTLFGVATSLGIGVMQIAAGLDFLELVDVADDSVLVPVVLIAFITGIATMSVVSGVARGIKWLSNFNMSLAGLVLLFVLITGPTIFILREFIQSIGLYLQQLLQLSFDLTAMEGGAGSVWQADWTTFYWGWWISWAPFVGVFIARISRGRTVREFVAGVLLVPTIVGFLWFSVFGGTALHRQIFGEGGLIGPERTVEQESSLFNMMGGLPFGTVLVAVTVVLIAIFFVTSSDSGSLVIDMLSSGGDTDPPTWSRVFWSVLEGAVAAALLIAGIAGGNEADDALMALRAAAIIIALPFSVVMILMTLSIWRQFRAEREALLRIQRRQRTDELTEELSHSLISEGVIEDPDGELRKRWRGRRSRRNGAGGQSTDTD